MPAHLLQQLLIALLEQLQVVIVGGEVVGAEIDADDIGLVTAEIPPLAEEGGLLAEIGVPGIARVFILHRHTGTGGA